METNGPTITMKDFLYERDKEYLKINMHSFGIKKYIPAFIEIWDKNLNVLHEWKLDLRPDQEDVVIEKTQLKLPEEFCIILNPKGKTFSFKN